MDTNDKDAFDEFDLPDFDTEPHAGGNHAAGHGGHGFDGGDDPFFENAPEMHAGHGHVHAGQEHGSDEFSDIPDEAAGEHGYHGEGEHVHDEGDVDGDGTVVHEPDGVEPKNPLSKFIVPGGIGIVLLGILGAYGYNGGFSHANVAPAVVAVPGPAIPGPGPRLPAANGPVMASAGPSASTGLPTALPGLPGAAMPQRTLSPPPGALPSQGIPMGMGGNAAAALPAQGISMPAQGTSMPAQGIPMGMGGNAAGLPSTPAGLPAGLASAAPAGSPAQGDLQNSLRILTEATTKMANVMDTRFTQGEDKMTHVQQALEGRMDKTDGKLDEMGGHVTGVENRVALLEQRLSAIETGHGGASREPDQHLRATRSAPAPVAVRDMHGEQAPMSARNARHSGMAGYTLHGVASGSAPDSAWVRTPQGFVLVKVGQAIQGAGSVTAINQVGNSWELVTTQGTIKPPPR